MKHLPVRRNFVAGFGSLAAGCIIALAALCGTGTSAAQTLVQDRIVAPIRAGAMQAVPGTVSPKTSIASDEGSLSGSTAIQGMSLVFRLSAAQEADLKNLLKQQQTPGSPMYHQWLKPGQFAARYGVSQADLAKIAAWLRQQGFRIDSIPPSADRIVFSGTAAQVNSAFQTQMHRYLLHGESRWANATPINVPQAVAGMTLRIGHLTTFRPRPKLIEHQVRLAPKPSTNGLKPQYTLQCVPNQYGCPSSGFENFVAPSDAQTIYDVNSLYNNNITGTGQTIAIVGQTDIETYKTDIQNFRSLSGLNASNMPTQVLVPGSGTAAVSSNDLQEADIDVEWAGAIAKDASIVYVTVGNNQNYSVFDSLQYAIQNQLANSDNFFIPVISISYGGCEKTDISQSAMDQMDQLLKQANAQGQTVVAAAGDDGSAQCDDDDTTVVAASHGLSVNYPASSAYATAAGGTSFSGDLSDQSKYWSQSDNTDNGSATGYIPETTWNDTATLAGLANAGSLSAGGGGASKVFSKPSWQTGPGVPADGWRDVPDISLDASPAHDGYVLCTESVTTSGKTTTYAPTCVYPLSGNEVAYFDASEEGYLFGGTSIAAPQLAAMITLWNQKAGNALGSGNINPILYKAAQSTPGAFHDITTGSNAVVCKSGSPDCVSSGSGYVMSCCSAGPGYDEATGLGTVDAAAMAAVWPSIQSANASFSLAAYPTAVSVTAGSSATTTVAVNPSGGFDGTVTLACSNLPADTTCSFSPTSANLSAGKALNVTVTFATTSAASRENPKAPFDRNWPLQTVFAGVFGLSIFGLGRKKRRFFPRGWMAVLLLLTGLMAAATLTACGGGSSGAGTSSPTPTPTPTPTSTTTTVTVTGTSGSNTGSAKIALTITS